MWYHTLSYHQWYHDCGITLYPITSGIGLWCHTYIQSPVVRIVVLHFIQSPVVSGLWYHTLSNHQWYQDCGITLYPITSGIRIVVSHFIQSPVVSALWYHTLSNHQWSRLWYHTLSNHQWCQDCVITLYPITSGIRIVVSHFIQSTVVSGLWYHFTQSPVVSGLWYQTLTNDQWYQDCGITLYPITSGIDDCGITLYPITSSQDCGITLYPITSGIRIVVSHFIQSPMVSGLWYHTLSNRQWYQDCGITLYPITSGIRIVVSHFVHSPVVSGLWYHTLTNHQWSRLWYHNLFNHQWYQDSGITLYPITSGIRIVVSHFIQSPVVSGLWHHSFSNHQ